MNMNEHIELYNDGKKHQPIVKVRVCEALGSKFPVGQKGNKRKKYVQGAPHLFLGIYEDENKNRRFYTTPLDEAIERIKQHLVPVPKELNDAKLKFWLSPNDLVYVPTSEEFEAQYTDILHIDKKRIYRFISSEGSTVYFLPVSVASSIKKGQEFESLDKSEKAIKIYKDDDNNDSQTIIKNCCWKLEVDRLGNITKIIR